MPTIEKKDYANNIEKAMKALEDNGRIIYENKETIEAYARYLVANDYSLSRIYKNLLYLPRMAEHIEVPFEKATKMDIEYILLWINSLNSAANTKRDYKVLLKRFYRWLGGGEYPKCIKWVKTDTKKNREVLPEDLLREEDILKMIDAADNPRDRALIAIIWETGARIGEIIDLQIKSFEDYKYGKKIVLHGKTGMRKVTIISSTPYIQEWLAVHPHKKDRNSYVWVNIGNVRKGDKMSYPAINKMLRETAKKAGIYKPVNPHHFRHSRATYMATKFTEAQLCQWFGWVQGSKVPATYVHLSGKDLDADYARLYGIEDPEEPKISLMAPKTCPRCGAIVESDARFCYKCGMVLDIDTAVEMEKMEDEVMDTFVRLEDPEVKRAFELVGKMYEMMKKDPEVAKKFDEENSK